MSKTFSIKITVIILLIIIISVLCFSFVYAEPVQPDEPLVDIPSSFVRGGKSSDIIISYFNGYTGDPTIGTLLYTGEVNGLYTSYRLNGWSDYYGFFDEMVLSEIPSDKHSLNTKYYVFNLTFNMLNASKYILDSIEYNGKTIYRCGYFYLANNDNVFFHYDFYFTDTVSGIPHNFLFKDNLTGEFFYLDTSFSSYEGNFLSFTISIPEYYLLGSDSNRLTINMSCSSIISCTAKPVNSLLLNNQSFLNMYAYFAASGDLYTFERIAFNYDEAYDDFIKNIANENFNKGYDAGYNDSSTILGAGWLTSLFSSLNSIFNFQLFGGITLGFVIFIPIVFSVILLILKLVRG